MCDRLGQRTGRVAAAAFAPGRSIDFFSAAIRSMTLLVDATGSSASRSTPSPLSFASIIARNLVS